MAISAQAPIVPIVNKPIYKVVDVSGKRVIGGVHKISILPAIPTAGLRLKDAAHLQSQLEKIFQKISKMQ